jgi:hypothetical protein
MLPNGWPALVSARIVVKPLHTPTFTAPRQEAG